MGFGKGTSQGKKQGGKERNPSAFSVGHLDQTGTAGLPWGDGAGSVQRQ